MDFDVIIAGAGPAGCLAARDLARSGLNVGLFDVGQRDKLTKPIIVEVEKSVFNAVGLEKTPQEDKVPYYPRRIRVFSPNFKEAFVISGEQPTAPIFLDGFVRRLLREAEAAGAKFFGSYRAAAPIVSEGRVCGASFDENGRRQDVKASLVIDATGFDAALVRKLDPELGIEFPDDSRDTVIAENWLHEIDPVKAELAIKEGAHNDEEAFARVGFAGPYSTEFSHLSLSNLRAYILIGRKAEVNAPSVGELVRDFIKRHEYYGERLHGGGGKIRISHSLDRLVTDGFMVIGEAACQVIPIHGSGVASGLYAGHLAAKVAATACKSGRPTTASLWPYAREYQRGRGGLLATFDVTRLTVESFTQDQVAAMVEAGIMCAEDMYNAVAPQEARMSLGTLPGRIRGLAKNPFLIRPIIRMGMATKAVKRHYAAYPSEYLPRDFAEWKQKTRNIFAPLIKR